MMDLLNQPINERALETLLAGDWQVSLNQIAQQSLFKIFTCVPREFMPCLSAGCDRARYVAVTFRVGCL